jgi:hypothetical protein
MDEAGTSFNFGHNEAKDESTLPSSDVSTGVRIISSCVEV